MQTRDFLALNRTAHKIKGSSGSIGALALQAAASALEAAATTSDAGRCRPLVLALELASQTFLAAITPDSLLNRLAIDSPTE
ncbi:MAG TPA: Hpt domain-containing protein [Planctomycetota bacterium]|nr:Hpt domain-containing protein [Planctomycetota bacterium]